MTQDAGRTAKLSVYGKNTPFSGNALERMLALIDEQQPGAGDEVPYRARHEYLPGAGQRGNASAQIAVGMTHMLTNAPISRLDGPRGRGVL